MINNKFNRQFKCGVGNNNIGNIIDYDFKDGVNTLKFSQMESKDIENYSISLMYQNCSICDVYEKDYDENDTESPLNKDKNKRYYPSKIYGLIELKLNTTLLINKNYVGYNSKNKQGIDIVCYCQDGIIYVNNEENNFKLVIDDLHNNIIEYTEEEIKEQQLIDLNIETSDYEQMYGVKIPFSLGKILEYVSKRYSQNGIIEDSFKLLNDENIYRPENVLLNITQQTWIYDKHNMEKIITTDHYKLGDRTNEDETIDDLLYITSGNRNDDMELYQTKENKIYYHSKYWGNKGCVYDQEAGKNTELYEEFKNIKMYNYTFECGMWMLHSKIDYDTVLSISNKYKTEFYRYCLMTEQTLSNLETQDR